MGAATKGIAQVIWTATGATANAGAVVSASNSYAPETSATDQGTWKLNEGGSLDLYFKTTAGGSLKPVAPTSIDIDFFYDTDTGTVLKNFHFNAPPTENGTANKITIWGSSDLTSTGIARAGMLRCRVKVVKTGSAGGVGDYNVDSDGGGSPVEFHKGGFKVLIVPSSLNASLVVKDSGPSGRHGVYIGDGLAQVSSTVPAFGKAVQFAGADLDGNSSGIRFPATGLGVSGSFTLRGFWTPDFSTSLAAMTFAGKWGNTVATQNIIFYVNCPTKKIALAVINSSGVQKTLDGVTALTTNTRYHLAAEYSSASTGTLWIYLNGVLEATLTGVGTALQAPDSTPFWIGRDEQVHVAADGPYVFKGVVDEVELLSSSVYGGSNFTPPTTPGSSSGNTLGLWHLEEAQLETTGLYKVAYGTAADETVCVAVNGGQPYGVAGNEQFILTAQPASGVGKSVTIAAAANTTTLSHAAGGFVTDNGYITAQDSDNWTSNNINLSAQITGNSLLLTGELWTEFASAPTGYSLSGSSILQKTTAFVMDPRISFGTITPRKSVYNRGETAQADFTLLNSRSESITRAMNWKIYDSTGTQKVTGQTGSGPTYLASYALGTTDDAGFDTIGNGYLLLVMGSGSGGTDATMLKFYTPDSSGNGFNGKAFPLLTTAPQPSQRAGKFSKALWFDGVNRSSNGMRVKLGSASSVYSGISYTTGFCVEAWIYRDSTASDLSNGFDIISDDKDGFGGCFLVIGISNGSVFGRTIDAANFSKTAIASGILSKGVWHHVAFVLEANNGNLKLYVDGVLAGSTTTPSLGSTGSGPVTIGGGAVNATTFSGRIDGVRISKVPRYTGAFTPTSSAFTTDASTRVLIQGDTLDNAVFFSSSKLLLGKDSTDAPANALTIATDQTLYNREETATLTGLIYFARGEVYASKSGVTRNVVNDLGTTESTVSDRTTSTTGLVKNAAGSATDSYVIGATDRASNNLTGFAKHVNYSHNGNSTDDSVTTFAVSRKWQVSSLGNGTIDGKLLNGKTASPGAFNLTSRNRGQTIYFNGYLYNARGELLASPTINFNVRPTGSDAANDTANQTLALASGQFTGSGANYVVDTAAVVGGKALVIASQSTATASNQVRSDAGALGSGNFAETSTGTPLWSVSATYTVETRTQKSATRTGSPEDTNFTIGFDTIYSWANVLDSTGDPVNAAAIAQNQLDPAGSDAKDQSATTGSSGWTPDPGLRYQALTPGGSGWIIRSTATKDGNSGTNDQGISMLSAYTANKSVLVGLSPLDNQPNVDSTLANSKSGNHPRYGDGLLAGFTFLEDGATKAVDSLPTPAFMIGAFNQSTNKRTFLQSDGSWKSLGDAGFAEYFFDFKAGLEGNLVWVSKIGTSGQGVTSGTGYLFDTSTWPKGLIYCVVRFAYNSQSFYDDDSHLLIADAPQHPFRSGSLPNANVIHEIDGLAFATGGKLSLK